MKVWTLTHCDCGKPAVAHSHDNEHEYAHCAECYLPWHKQRKEETAQMVRQMLAEATCSHAQSMPSADGHGAFCASCGTTLA